MKNNNQKIGKFGESLAVSYLQKNGYTILERNFHGRPGELDIIARQANVVIFIEVKTRRTLRYGLPEEAVTSKKLNMLRQTSEWYLHTHHMDDVLCRVDVISIDMSDLSNPKLSHITNVLIG